MSIDPSAAVAARVDTATGIEAPQQSAAVPARELLEVAAAIGRVEALIAAGSAPVADSSAAVEKIADIAFVLHERAVEASLCDALDAAVREISDAGARNQANTQQTNEAAELLRDLSHRVNAMIAASETALGAEPDLSPAAAPAATTIDAAVMGRDDGDEAGEDEIPSAGLFEAETLEDDHFAQTVAALAAALPALAEFAEPTEPAAELPPAPVDATGEPYDTPQAEPAAARSQNEVIAADMLVVIESAHAVFLGEPAMSQVAESADQSPEAPIAHEAPLAEASAEPPLPDPPTGEPVGEDAASIVAPASELSHSDSLFSEETWGKAASGADAAGAEVRDTSYPSPDPPNEPAALSEMAVEILDIVVPSLPESAVPVPEVAAPIPEPAAAMSEPLAESAPDFMTQALAEVDAANIAVVVMPSDDEPPAETAGAVAGDPADAAAQNVIEPDDFGMEQALQSDRPVQLEEGAGRVEESPRDAEQRVPLDAAAESLVPSIEESPQNSEQFALLDAATEPFVPSIEEPPRDTKQRAAFDAAEPLLPNIEETPQDSEQRTAPVAAEPAAPSAEEPATTVRVENSSALLPEFQVGPEEDPGDLFEPFAAPSSAAPAEPAVLASAPVQTSDVAPKSERVPVPPAETGSAGPERLFEPVVSPPRANPPVADSGGAAMLDVAPPAVAPPPAEPAMKPAASAPPLAPSPPPPAPSPPPRPAAAASSAPSRAATNDPLAAVRALGEEELIALFS